MAAPTRRAVLISAAALAACSRPTMALGREAFQDGHPHILMEATVGGKYCLAVVDNAAPTSGVDIAYAQQQGLDGLEQAPITLADQPFMAVLRIDDLSELAIATEAPVNAIVGRDLFLRYAVGIDFGARQLSLYERAGFSPPHAARPQHVEMAARREPSISVIIDGGKPFQAMVDLGCSAPLLVSPAFARLHGIGQGRAVSTRQGVISTPDGFALRASPLTSVGEVKIAGHKVRDVPVTIMPEAAGPFALYDAVVGLPLLRCFDLWLSLPEQIWMKPTARLAAPLERRFTGIQVKPVAKGLLIRHVAANSPAQAAGLEEGDLITALNDEPPTQRRLREAKPGERLNVRLQTGETRLVVAARYC